jgi:lipopolysaccharide export system ATP-binding protein
MGTLQTLGLVKSFRSRTVVNGVSIEVNTGEIVGLLGPNGAGKTTMFYMLVGLYRPEKGAVMLDDEPITNLPMYKRARKGISYLAQEASVFTKLSVRENVLAILETMDMPRKRQLDRTDELLDDLGITHIADSKAYMLSGGERRRVEITRCLATQPNFILLDEPFAGIDPIAVSDIQNLVTGLKERGIGVLITDHNVRETLNLCDRAYILAKGELLEQGDAQTIANSEKARKVYLGEDFRL